MLRIKGGIQNYDWGKLGNSSLVSIFSDDDTSDRPCAEFWIGTHINLPSRLYSTDDLLTTHTGELPCLMKVLSIAKPLSIQVHPNKNQAKMLFHDQPHLYKDPQHKPELCVALSPMRLLYGFKEDMTETWQRVPELASLVDVSATTAEQLHALFSDEEKTRQHVTDYLNRVKNDSLSNELNRHFPGDVGIFFSMFMQYLEIPVGSGILIHPGYPHCYLEGDCVEVMACSDNVVRAGLTPKLKDVQTLLRITDFTCNNPVQVLQPQKLRDSLYKYPSSYPEFSLFCLKGEEETFIDFPALCLVIEGSAQTDSDEAQNLCRGQSFYVEGPCTVRPTPFVHLYLCATINCSD